jgi:glutathione synthase/RimK-type ligase-like ATP-grasp enzyme
MTYSPAGHPVFDSSEILNKAGNRLATLELPSCEPVRETMAQARLPMVT